MGFNSGFKGLTYHFFHFQCCFTKQPANNTGLQAYRPNFTTHIQIIFNVKGRLLMIWYRLRTYSVYNFESFATDDKYTWWCINLGAKFARTTKFRAIHHRASLPLVLTLLYVTILTSSILRQLLNSQKIRRHDKKVAVF